MPSDAPAKKCPFCAEEIHPEAIKCRYCGSMLQGSAPVRENACRFCNARISKGARQCPNCGGILRGRGRLASPLRLVLAFFVSAAIIFGAMLLIQETVLHLGAGAAPDAGPGVDGGAARPRGPAAPAPPEDPGRPSPLREPPPAQPGRQAPGKSAG